MDFYEKYWTVRGRSGNRPRYGIFYDWIKSGSSVLDIGCGDGYLGEVLTKNKKINYLGCDISDTALNIAKSRGLEVVKLDAAGGFDKFAPKSFDYVLMSEFIEHITNSEEVLEKIGQIARLGVLVSIPNIAYWKFRRQLLFGRFPKQWAISPREHLRFWSVPDFVYTARSLGFKIEKRRASNGRKVLRDLWPNLFGFQICFYLKPLD